MELKEFVKVALTDIAPGTLEGKHFDSCRDVEFEMNVAVTSFDISNWQNNPHS